MGSHFFHRSLHIVQLINHNNTIHRYVDFFIFCAVNIYSWIKQKQHLRPRPGQNLLGV